MKRVMDASSAERHAIVVRTSADPTGSPPEYGVTTTHETPPGSWVVGQWVSAWDSDTKLIESVTPIMGEGEALAVTGEQTYVLWIRWTVSGETPVKDVGIIQVR